MKSSEEKLYYIWRYLTLFVLIAFVITASFFLMFYSIQVDKAEIARRAPLVLGNVLFLSAFCCGVEWLLRKLTTDRVVRRIREATSRMAAGDLTVRIDTEGLMAPSRDFNQIARDFNQMAEELASIETLRTDFVSSVSHELKTPLAVVRNYAVLLKAPNLSEEKRKEYIDGISQAIDRTSTLMTNILKLNKLEHQAVMTQGASYDLGAQLAECLASFSELWEEKEIEVEADIEENLTVTADPEMMSIVWNNLISNALKFTDRGGRISVSARQAGGWIEVSVSDTGCGMDEKTGRHIFEKFYQGDSSHATEGNGLGLAMVKRIVDIIGGEIRVQSTLGHGSVFTVRIRRSSDASV